MILKKRMTTHNGFILLKRNAGYNQNDDRTYLYDLLVFNMGKM